MTLEARSLLVGEARIIGLRLVRETEGVRESITPTSAKLKVVRGVTTVINDLACGISGQNVYYFISSADVTSTAGTCTATYTINYGTEIIKVVQTITVTA